MTPRQIISRILIVALLAHAAAIVRHHILMLGATDAALAASVSGPGLPICHVDLGDQGGLDKSTPSKLQQSCPICSGLAFMAGLPAPQDFEFAQSREVDILEFGLTDLVVGGRDHAWPPGRGPPAA